jgi:hypothetical protein
LSENHRSENQIELDFDKLARVGSKVNELLAKRTRGSVEAYAVLRFLCVYYETDLGIAFQPEFEEELRKVVKQNLESKEPEPDAQTR